MDHDDTPWLRRGRRGPGAGSDVGRSGSVSRRVLPRASPWGPFGMPVLRPVPSEDGTHASSGVPPVDRHCPAVRLPGTSEVFWGVDLRLASCLALLWWTRGSTGGTERFGRRSGARQAWVSVLAFLQTSSVSLNTSFNVYASVSLSVNFK